MQTELLEATRFQTDSTRLNLIDDPTEKALFRYFRSSVQQDKFPENIGNVFL